MSYVPDPVNVNEPLNTEKAGTAAAEFRALKAYIQTALAKLAGATFTGSVTAVAFAGSGAGLTNLPWSSVTGRPTTIAGYGITDAIASDGSNATGTWNIGITGNAATASTATFATSSLSASSAASVTWSGVSGKPTTRDGYGISDVPKFDGVGATGTWGISISGNAGTATSATFAATAANANAAISANTLTVARKINNIDFNGGAAIGLGSFICYNAFTTLGFTATAFTSLVTASATVANRNMSSLVAPFSGFARVSVSQVSVALTAGTEGTGYVALRVKVAALALNPEHAFKDGAKASLSLIVPVTAGDAIDFVGAKVIGTGSGATYTIGLTGATVEMISSS